MVLGLRVSESGKKFWREFNLVDGENWTFDGNLILRMGKIFILVGI